jgi:putative nucleotidyltransferase with HDIG domain
MTPEELVAGTGPLVSLPRAYHRISEMLDDPRYGIGDIGRVIGHEPALTARVLRLANSAYYRLPEKVDSITLAISVLGTRNLRDLLLATSVASAFARIDTGLVDVADFWHHSIYCGILARLLGKRLKAGSGEQLFVAGLLHDIGKLVIYQNMPEQAGQIIAESASTGEPVCLIERARLGFDHGEVGQALLQSWGLPDLFSAVAANHHQPRRDQPFAHESALVHIANQLSKPVEPGHKLRRGTTTPALHPDAAALIDLQPELAEELKLEADVQSIEVFSTLFSGAAVAR